MLIKSLVLALTCVSLTCAPCSSLCVLHHMAVRCATEALSSQAVFVLFDMSSQRFFGVNLAPQGIAMRSDKLRRAVGLPTMAEMKSMNTAVSQVQ